MELEELAARRERAVAVPARYRGATSPDADALLADILSRSASGAYVCGPVGSGKTWLACSVALAAARDGRAGRVRFANAVAMLAGERDSLADRTRSGGRLAPWLDAGLLVVDDLDKPRPTDWAVESLYLLFEHRCGAGLPTVVTANSDPASLAARLGGDAMAQAVVDRLRDGARLVTLSGASRRRWA